MAYEQGPALHVGHVFKESQSPAPHFGLDIFQVSAIFQPCIRYLIEPAGPEYTTQAMNLECLQVADINIQQGPWSILYKSTDFNCLSRYKIQQTYIKIIESLINKPVQGRNIYSSSRKGRSTCVSTQNGQSV